MAGCKTGVATILLQKEPQALYTHCYGHALNLAVQESVQANLILGDTLDTVEEMTKLIKKSPKQKTIWLRMILHVNHLEYACYAPPITLFVQLLSTSENFSVLRETWSLA